MDAPSAPTAGGVWRAARDGGPGGLRRPDASHPHPALVRAGGEGHRRGPPVSRASPTGRNWDPAEDVGRQGPGPPSLHAAVRCRGEAGSVRTPARPVPPAFSASHTGRLPGFWDTERRGPVPSTATEGLGGAARHRPPPPLPGASCSPAVLQGPGWLPCLRPVGGDWAGRLSWTREARTLRFRESPILGCSSQVLPGLCVMFEIKVAARLVAVLHCGLCG